MMMYHHTKFGYKMFSGSEGIIQTIEILNVCCDLDLEHSNPIFSLDTFTYDNLPLK